MRLSGGAQEPFEIAAVWKLTAEGERLIQSLPGERSANRPKTTSSENVGPQRRAGINGLQPRRISAFYPDLPILCDEIFRRPERIYLGESLRESHHLLQVD